MATVGNEEVKDEGGENFVEAEFARLKGLAADNFKAKMFEAAIVTYNQACAVLKNGGDTNDKLYKRSDLLWQGNYVICKSNASQCCINIKDFKGAAQYASEALAEDPRNVKSLYRRAMAKESLGETAEALDDLNFALVVERSNKHLEAEVRRINDKIKIELEVAAKSGDVQVFTRYCKVKVEVFLKDDGTLDFERHEKYKDNMKNYFPYVHIAAEFGREKVVEFLYNNIGRFYVNILDMPKKRGDATALMVASEKGHERVVDLLLSANVNINAVTNGMCTLITESDATKMGIQVPDGQCAMKRSVVGGYSALLYAAREGNLKIAEKLLKKGAKIHQRCDMFCDKTDSGACTAIMFAIIKGNLPMVELLLSYGADFKDKTSELESSTYFRGIGQSVGQFSQPEYPIKLTCLMLASLHGHEDILRLLLSKGASVHDCDSHGNTALYHAIYGRHQECIELLLEHGSNPNLFAKVRKDKLTGFLNVPNEKCVTALHIAVAALSSPSTLYNLLDYGADRNLAKQAGNNSTMQSYYPSLLDMTNETTAPSMRLSSFLRKEAIEHWNKFDYKDVILNYHPYSRHGRGAVPELIRRRAVYMCNTSVAEKNRFKSLSSLDKSCDPNYDLVKVQEAVSNSSSFKSLGVQLQEISRFQRPLPGVAVCSSAIMPAKVYLTFNGRVEYDGVLEKKAASATRTGSDAGSSSKPLSVNVKVYFDNSPHSIRLYHQECTIWKALPGHECIVPLLSAIDDCDCKINTRESISTSSSERCASSEASGSLLGNLAVSVSTLSRTISLDRYYNELRDHDMFPQRFEKASNGMIKSTTFPPNTSTQERGIIPYSASRKILCQIASGLCHMHANKVVHLDFKSSNILIDCSTCSALNYGPYPSDCRIFISNFVSAQVITTERSKAEYRGTIPFMAPEALEERENCDLAKVDMYAFGMLIYELLRGDLPWLYLYDFTCRDAVKHAKEAETQECDSAEANFDIGIDLAHLSRWGTDIVAQKVLRGERPPVDQRWDKSLVQLMRRCWSQEPDERPTAFQVYLALLPKEDRDVVVRFTEDSQLTADSREATYSFLKSLATDLFKDKQFEASCDTFLKAFEVIAPAAGAEHLVRGQTATSCGCSVDDAIGDKFRSFAAICQGNAAQCAINLGKHNSAVEYATIALSFEPTNIKNLYRRGVSHLALKQKDLGLADLQRALALDPSNESVTAAIAKTQ